MNKQEILQSTGLSESEFYKLYPTEESFKKKNPKMKLGGTLKKAQAGVQTQTQQQAKPNYQFSKEDIEKFAKQKQAADFNAQQSKYIEQPGTVYNSDDKTWLSNMYNGWEQMNTNQDGNRNHVAELLTFPFQAGARLAGSLDGQYSYGAPTDPMSYVNTAFDMAAVLPGTGTVIKNIGKELKPFAQASSRLAKNVGLGMTTPIEAERIGISPVKITPEKIKNLEEIDKLSNKLKEPGFDPSTGKGVKQENLLRMLINSSLTDDQLFNLKGSTRLDLEKELEMVTGKKLDVYKGKVGRRDYEKFLWEDHPLPEGITTQESIPAFLLQQQSNDLRRFIPNADNIENAVNQKLNSQPPVATSPGQPFTQTVNQYIEHIRQTNLTNDGINRLLNYVDPRLRTAVITDLNLMNKPAISQTRLKDMIFSDKGFEFGQKIRGFLKKNPNVDEFIPPAPEINEEIKDVIPSLFKREGETNSTVASKMKKAVDNVINGPPGFYKAAGSLSANSAPNYFKIAARQLSGNPDIKFHFKGWTDLNGSGFLNEANVPQEQILEYLKNITNDLRFNGKKMPSPYKGRNGEIMIPNIVIEKVGPKVTTPQSTAPSEINLSFALGGSLPWAQEGLSTSVATRGPKQQLNSDQQYQIYLQQQAKERQRQAEIVRQSQTKPNVFNNFRGQSNLIDKAATVTGYDEAKAKQRKIQDQVDMLMGAGAISAASVAYPPLGLGLGAAGAVQSAKELPDVYNSWTDPNQSKWEATKKTGLATLGLLGATPMSVTNNTFMRGLNRGTQISHSIPSVPKSFLLNPERVAPLAGDIQELISGWGELPNWKYHDKSNGSYQAGIWSSKNNPEVMAKKFYLNPTLNDFYEGLPSDKFLDEYLKSQQKLPDSPNIGSTQFLSIDPNDKKVTEVMRKVPGAEPTTIMRNKIFGYEADGLDHIAAKTKAMQFYLKQLQSLPDIAFKNLKDNMELVGNSNLDIEQTGSNLMFNPSNKENPFGLFDFLLKNELNRGYKDPKIQKTFMGLPGTALGVVKPFDDLPHLDKIDSKRMLGPIKEQIARAYELQGLNPDIHLPDMNQKYRNVGKFFRDNNPFQQGGNVNTYVPMYTNPEEYQERSNREQNKFNRKYIMTDDGYVDKKEYREEEREKKKQKNTTSHRNVRYLKNGGSAEQGIDEQSFLQNRLSMFVNHLKTTAQPAHDRTIQKEAFEEHQQQMQEMMQQFQGQQMDYGQQMPVQRFGGDLPKAQMWNSQIKPNPWIDTYNGDPYGDFYRDFLNTQKQNQQILKGLPGQSPSPINTPQIGFPGVNNSVLTPGNTPHIGMANPSSNLPIVNQNTPQIQNNPSLPNNLPNILGTGTTLQHWSPQGNGIQTPYMLDNSFINPKTGPGILPPINLPPQDEGLPGPTPHIGENPTGLGQKDGPKTGKKMDDTGSMQKGASNFDWMGLVNMINTGVLNMAQMAENKKMDQWRKSHNQALDTYAAKVPGNRGDYFHDPYQYTGSEFRPDQQMWRQQFGKEGGTVGSVVDMTEEELEEFLKCGGQVEYL